MYLLRAPDARKALPGAYVLCVDKRLASHYFVIGLIRFVKTGVDSPSREYGIFITIMLEEAER